MSRLIPIVRYSILTTISVMSSFLIAPLNYCTFDHRVPYNFCFFPFITSENIEAETIPSLEREISTSRALIPIWRFTCYISPSLFLLPSSYFSALNFLYISFSFAKFQLAGIQPATSSVVIVRHLSVTFYYCLVGYYRHYIPPLSDPPPESFLFSFSSFRTSFRLLPRAQRLLTKLRRRTDVAAARYTLSRSN